MKRSGTPRAIGAALNRRYRRAAVGAFLALALTTVAVFLKRDPFAHPFQIQAVFSTAAELSNGSPVRIAGIQVGQVDGIAHGPHNTAMVTMGIDSGGLPVHTDATLTIKPRLLLEGNAYVDLDPGTPDTPDLRSGNTVPVRQTAVSVQIDQLLDLLDQPIRGALQASVGQLAHGFGGVANSGGTPPGYAGLRDAVRQLDSALRPVSQVASAVQGTQPGDLRGALNGTGAVTAQLAEDPAALADFVTSYDDVVATLTSRDRALAASISGIDGVLRAAPEPLSTLNASLPALTSFAGALGPALVAAPRPLTDASRFLDQVAALVRPAALPVLLDRLGPVLGDLPTLERRLETLFSYTTPVTDCLSTHVVPTLDMKIQDGSNTTGDPVYLDMLHMFTGLTSLASAVDGNGGTLRLGVTTGDHAIETVIPGLGPVVGQVPDVDGVRPTWLGYGVDPPFRPDQPCATQRLVDLNVAAGPVPEWARAYVSDSSSG